MGVVTVTGLRKSMVSSIPASLKIAISAGIGFFIAIIGLFNTGIIVHGNGSALAAGDLSDPGVLLAAFCIITTINLWYCKKWYAIPLSMFVTWVLGMIMFYAGITSDVGTIPNGDQLTGLTVPDFDLFGKVFTGFEMFEGTLVMSFIAAS